MKTIGQRFTYLYDLKTKKGMEKAVIRFGKASRTIQSWMYDAITIPTQNILEIKKDHPNLNLNWLLTGEGQAFLDDQERSEVINNMQIIEEAKKDRLDLIEEKQEKILTWIDSMNNFMKMGKNYDVPERATA